MNLFVILFYNEEKRKVAGFFFCFVLCSFLLLHKWKSLVYLVVVGGNFCSLYMFVINFFKRRKNVKNAVESVVRCEDLKLFHGEFFPKEFFHQKNIKIKIEGGKV